MSKNNNAKNTGTGKDKASANKTIALNRSARHDFHLEDRYEAGIALTGTEVKSLRIGRVNLTDGYAFIEGGEVWLDAVQIPQYSHGNWTNHPPRRKRKLLLHKAEIVKISHAVSAGGYTLVPLKLYWKNGNVKLEIGLAKGKQSHDKRATEKDRDWQRQKQRLLRSR